MNEPKRHHYVTRAYMRRFSNDEHVYVLFKKDDNNCTITQKPTSIENICVETDFYTVFEEDEKKNSSVERLLARFEDETPNTVFSYIQPDLVFPFQEGGTILDARQKKDDSRFNCHPDSTRQINARIWPIRHRQLLSRNARGN